MKPFVFTGLSPNTRSVDAWLAFKMLFFAKKDKKNAVVKLEHWFRKYFGVEHAYCVDSGRAALQLALSAGGIQAGDEVILQAFTCIVVSNAITALGATPVYVDCQNDYLINPDLVEAAITSKTKALIIQHTFGAAADVQNLNAIAKKHGLLVVEDCAHALGESYNGTLLGNFGDMAIFSFGSDKVISGVRGGVVLANIHRPDLGLALKNLQSKLPKFPISKEIQHLLHPIFFYFGKKTYHLGIGKALLYVAKKLRLMNRIIDQTEKQGRVPKYFPAQLPGSLATLAFNQIKHLDAWNSIRKNIVTQYVQSLKNKKSVQRVGETSMWLRFPVQVSDPKAFRVAAVAKGVFLGDWYSTAIAPSDSNYEAAQYTKGSCPVAENIGKGIINLPTDPSLTKTDLNRIISLFS